MLDEVVMMSFHIINFLLTLLFFLILGLGGIYFLVRFIKWTWNR